MKATLHRRLLKTTALIAILAIPTHAYAAPDGGVTTSGSATINTSGNATTITQSTDRAIIRWNSFDLNASESVQFVQPSSSSITVNRIRDTKASRIDGHIGANGNIILINPNGIVFGSTATVDVNSLVATSSDLDDDNAFMAGGAVKFTKPGNADAAIINHGTMTVKQGGLVGLVAPNVENHGIIEARLGKVVLASGDIATIDFAGDGLIKLEVTDAVLAQRVINTGTIKADGGTILMTAAQARTMIDALVSNTGTLQANTFHVNGVQKTGSITLTTKGLDITLPRGNGMVFTAGTIKAEGDDVNEAGGMISILSDVINIGDGSYVTASGDTNGGTILIGGNYQGGSGLPTSDLLYVAEDVILSAESRRLGAGGLIVLWSDTNTRFYGHADASAFYGDAGMIEVSSKGSLDFGGTIDLTAAHGARGTLLLDPTDIVISNAVDNNVTGAAPFTPNIDNGPSNLNITTLQNALANGNVIVQTRSTGAQAGNITVSNAITWVSGSQLTLDAHNNIIVNAAITGQNLRFVVGNDLQLNAGVAGSGTLTIEQAGDATTVGVGASAAGTMNLNATDLSNITDGWANIVIGKSSGTGAVDFRAITWNDNLTVRSASGVITFTGTQTMGANNLTVQTDADIVLTGNLTGTGTLTIAQTNAATTMGLGGGTGTVNLSAAEVGRITNGWNSIVLGRADASGQLNFSALTWNDNLTIQSGAGLINVTGVQTMGTNNLDIITDSDVTLGIANALTGSGALSISQSSVGTTIGLNDTGTINFTTTEVARFRDGWASITIGRTDGTGAVNMGALSWTDALNIQSGSGVINVNGAQAVAGNALTFRTDSDINIAAALTGTGNLTITQSSVGTSMGIGTGQAGTINISTAEIALMTDGWATRSFGRTDGSGDLNIAGSSWVDNLQIQTGSGALNINGALSMAANNLTIRTDTDLAIGYALTGTGTLAISGSSASTSMGIGTGQAGTLLIDSIELGYITNGWTSLVFGLAAATGDMNVGSMTWLDPITLRNGTGALNINGAQTLSANNMIIYSNADLAINAAIAGSGTLYILPTDVTVSMGIGTGQTGTLYLDDTELSRITNGFTDIILGATTQTGAMNVGTRSWTDRLTLRTLSGIISINGTQTMAGNNLTISTNSDLAINAGLTGTGTLTFIGTTASTVMGVGTGQTGTLSLSDADLNNITDGWTTIVLGGTSYTGAINVGARSWNDNLYIYNNTGIVSINGTQTMNANNMLFRVNSNLALNADLVGTGTLTIYNASNGTTMGIGTGQAGTISLIDAELARIIDGWGTIVFGGTSMTGTMNVAAHTWFDSVDFRTSTGALNINGAQNVGSSNLTLRTNTNLVIGYALTGTGTITIMPAGNTAMGVGTGQTGTLSLTDTELGFITNGWANIIMGNSSTTAALNVGAYTWNDSVDFRTGTGILSINGAQNVGANNLTIRSAGNPVIGAALTGTGIISLIPSATGTSTALGTGQTGTFSFTDTELAFITNGWAGIVVGANTITGALNIGALTWNDNLTLNTSTGVITINGTQTMGANDLTIITSGNLGLASGNLSGTGRLSISQNAANTSMGIGDLQTGTLNFTNAELARIVDGWTSVTFGRTDGTGVVNVGAYTWLDNITIQGGSGLMTIAGAQTMGANNLTLSTDSNLALNGNLSGTGSLNIKTSGLTTTMGIGTGQTGTLALADTELARILNGWAQVTLGSTGGLGAMNIGAYTWLDKMIFVTQGNVVLNGVQNTTETSGNTLVYATTGGAFINNAGSSAINPGAGRYLVYSVDAGNDTLGGITPPNVLLNKSYAAYSPAMVVEAGSIHLYSGAVSKILYLTIDNKDKIYGDNLPTFSYTYIAGLQAGDLLTDAITAYTMTVIGSSVFDNAGVTRAITGNFTTGLGYSVVVTNGTLTVVKATVLVESDAVSRVYGDVNPTLTASYSGFKNGDDETDIDTLVSINTTANLTSNVGAYAIVSSGAIDNNYDFTYADDNLTVTKATLTATVQNNTRVYGDADPAFTVNYTGFKNSETSAVIDTLATGSTATTGSTNVGSYTITGAGGVDNNYSFNYINGSMTITKAALTITADSKSRLYGDANPALTASYSGFKNGETSSVLDTAVNLATAANATSNVAGYTITASGAADINYNISYVSGTLTVNKATLTATAGNGTREYGDANPALGVTYTGFKNSETSAVIDTAATASSAANATSNVGSYTTVASGGIDNNYNFTYVDGSLSVTKATVTATAANGTREYGDVNPALGVTYSGFKNGETSAVVDTGATAASAANATSNVGSYTTVASGGIDNNYNFNYVNGSLNVTKATLTATAANGSREYGDANPAFGVTYTGFKNSETSAVIDTAATASSAAGNTSNVGTYATTASGGIDNNYSFAYVDGVLTINKATLTATAGNGTREYGDANPALGVSYAGFKNGETSVVIDTAATASSAANNTSNVGSYSTTASGAVDNNYSFTYVNGLLSVTKAALTATASNGSREYGDANPALTVSYAGFKNGETSAVIDTGATASSAANNTSNVGSYTTVAAGGVDNNYSFTYVDGALSVTKATLTATAANGSRDYGDANPALGVTYTGFKNGQTASVIDTAATAGSAANNTSGVGTYATVASGATDNNYNFTYVDGVLTVNKATLTATAGNGTREYGDANPALGVSYTGFKNGETSAVINTGATASSAANNTSNVGSYATVASGAVDDNYAFTYVNGALTVTKAMLTATAGDSSREYGDANSAIGVSYSGFKNGETSAVINTGAGASSAANAASNVGTYTTVASGASDNNYDFTYVDGVLTVDKATLTATAGNASRAYGDANPALGVSYTGFKNGQNSSVIDTGASASSAAGNTSGVGTYTTVASGASDNNYDFTYVDGVLTVNKAVLTATASDGTREYGDANPGFTVSYTGFKNGETSTVIDTAATASSAANNTSNVGSYNTTASGGIDNNYSFSYVNGALTVTKATLTATAGNGARAYGDSNPSIGVTYTGFKNGETSSVLNTLATGSSAANATSNVGSYATSASGGVDNNYAFTYAGGTLTINKANLTVTANDVERKIGEAEPALTVSYNGFKNSENASVLNTAPHASTAVNGATPEGTYSIAASGGIDNNYSFSYVGGAFTIRAADYVPPVVTVPANPLPSTVSSRISTPPVINPATSNSLITLPANAHHTIAASAQEYFGNREQAIAVVTVNSDYIGAWQASPYLIALTDDLQAFYMPWNIGPSSGSSEDVIQGW